MPYNPNKMSAAPDTRQERGPEQERPKKRVKSEGAPPAEAARLRREEEASRSLHIEELQKRLGVKQLTDPEAMLFALIDRGDVTVERLNDTQRFIEAAQIRLQQEMLQATDPDKKAELQKTIEGNSRLIFKIEDARHAIESAGAENRPDDASQILDKVMARDRDIAKGAEKAIQSMEQEQAKLEAELESLYKEIESRESGAKKAPGVARRLSLGFSNLLRRISNQQEQAPALADMSSRDLTFKRREIQQRLNQLEMNLINMRPPKKPSERMWTPAPAVEEKPIELGEEDIISEEEEAPPTERMRRAPRPLTAEEIAAQPGMAEQQLAKAKKMAEARINKLIKEKDALEKELAETEKKIASTKDMLKSAPLPSVRQGLRKFEAKRDQLTAQIDKIIAESLKLTPTTMPERPIELGEADIISSEELPVELGEADIIESEEISGVRRKPRATPPPLPEAAKLTPAERARQKREAEEAARARERQEVEAKEKAEFQKKVSWAEGLLPGGQAAAMNQDVLGQLGVNWNSANEQQRNFSVEYVFKAAAVQEALKSGNDKAYDRAKQELQNFEKTLGLVRSPYFEPAGKAGVGVTLETGRADQGRTARRMAGAGAEAARGRVRARRAENLAPPIEAITTEQAEMLENLGKLEKKEAAERAAAQEEKFMAGARAAQEALTKAKVPEVPEHIKLQAEMGKRMMNPMSVEQTAAIVPKARELWDLVNEQLGNKKFAKAEKTLSALKDGGETNPATLYVMAMARYLEAANEPATVEVINAFAQRVMDANKALGLEGNALVQSVMAERGKKFGKAAGRNVKGAARQEETRRGGRTL